MTSVTCPHTGAVIRVPEHILNPRAAKPAINACTTNLDVLKAHQKETKP